MTTEHEDNRARLLASAGRGFRAKGFAALGVDGLAKDAGLTSGSFYVHFKSKTQAFLEALRSGMRELAGGIDHAKATMGARWQEGLIEFYLTVRRSCAPGEACALQAMSSDVARLGPEARRTFEAELRHVLDRMTEGTPSSRMADERLRALALLSLLSGAVTLARACEDQQFGDEIVEAARHLAGTLAHPARSG